MRRADGNRVAVAADGAPHAGMSVERATAPEVRTDLGLGCFEEGHLPDRRGGRLCAEVSGHYRGREKQSYESDPSGSTHEPTPENAPIIVSRVASLEFLRADERDGMTGRARCRMRSSVRRR